MTHHTDGEERGDVRERHEAIVRRFMERERAGENIHKTVKIRISELPQPVEAAPHGKTRTKTKDR